MKFKLIGGTHREGTNKYKEGDIVESDRDLSKKFRNQFKLIPTEPEETKPTASKPQRSFSKELAKLKVQKRSPGWYDVINTETGEKVNDRALRKKEAEAFIGEG